MPDMPMTDDQARWILRHELEHIRHRDMWIKLVYLLYMAAFWWFPLVYPLRDELDSMLELRCDAALMRHAGQEQRKEYMSAIYSLLEGLHKKRSREAVATASFACSTAERNITLRFRRLAEKKRKKTFAQWVVSIALVTLFIGSYFVILQPVSEPPAEECAGMYTSENAYLVDLGDGTYKVCSYGGDEGDAFILTAEDIAQSNLDECKIYTEEEINP